MVSAVVASEAVGAGAAVAAEAAAAEAAAAAAGPAAEHYHSPPFKKTNWPLAQMHF